MNRREGSLPMAFYVALVVGVIVASACGGTPDLQIFATATSPAAQPLPTEPGAGPANPTPVGSELPPAVGASSEELAQATVQILAMIDDGTVLQAIWTGSGSIISPDGLILTNGHVVDDRWDEYTHLGVATTGRTDQPPQLEYLAVIAAVDYDLDLAVIRIISDIDGNQVTLNLPYIALGDSDGVEIGEALRILGYPGIGGETITFTSGAVSGFTSERGVEGRAWIKTDTTIAGGNSGGMGANEEGQLIGVPTQVSAGVDVDIADCRVLVDTNRDGVINELDDCIPVGGFLNGLRPVNLALPLIEAARTGQQYVVGAGPEEAPAGGFDLSYTDFSNIRFSDDVTEDDQPTQILPIFPSNSYSVCAFWDYEGMVDGMSWSAFWFIDGLLDEGGSIPNDTWIGGETGSWWVCIFNNNGLPDGLYELVLQVEGEVMGTEAVYVGGGRTMVDFTLSNQSSVTVCYVLLSPNEAQNWGQDELGATEVISSSADRTFRIGSGVYDMLLLDCDTSILLEEYGIDVFEDSIYTLSD
ncbi:MAG: serine protease [Anaerolineales bacterium]